MPSSRGSPRSRITRSGTYAWARSMALIAIGIFMGGVAYLHWSGGTLGDGSLRIVQLAFGALGYAVPAALIVGGGLVLLRELRPQLDDARAARLGEAEGRAGRRRAR